MNVYFISGLGADKRVFQKLEIDPDFKPVFIEWIRPEKKETIESYASRLSAQIDTTRPFQIVGLSFGGMIATVMAEQLHPEQIILISSSSIGVPLNKFYRGLIDFLLLSPLSAPFMKSANAYTYRMFGAHTDEEKKLLRSILKDTDSRFLKWALKAISRWDHPQHSPLAFQINGSADRLIRPGFIQPDIVIKDGEHLMVWTRADEISPIVNTQLLKRYR